jgi:hypothetical protein
LFPGIALLAGLTLEIYLTQTAWIHWLEAQNYAYSYAILLPMALVPVLVLSILVRWMSHWMTTGVSRLLHPAPARSHSTGT